jgi:hypothetical protein
MSWFNHIYLDNQDITEEMKIIHSIHHFPEQVLFMIVFSLSPYKTMEYFAPNYYWISKFKYI